MSKNKSIQSALFGSLFITLSFFTPVNSVFASLSISSFLLNGSSQNVNINPNNSESVSIEVKANTPVKFTRLYICSINQICNGASGNYTRYFTQSDVSDTIIKSWNGKRSGDVEIAPAGEYKVMVSMTEGANAPVLEFGQYSIFVDFSAAVSTSTDSNNFGGNNNPESTTTISLSNTLNSSAVNGTANVSTHSGEEDLSDYSEKTIFETTAGRERTASIGCPIEFKAKYNLLQNNQCAPVFKWSFGDGFEATNKNVIHTYKYPGEYQVVLNGNCGDYNSVSRTKVAVFSPSVSISDFSEDSEQIINNSKIEINIGNWKIKGGQKDFIFPQDTIISAGNKIVLSKEDIGVNALTSRISISNPAGREVSYFYIKNVEQRNPDSASPAISNQHMASTSSSTISVLEAENLLKQYKETLTLNSQKINKVENTNIVHAIDEVEVKKSVENDLPENKGIVQTATVMDSVGTTSIKSFWANLVDFPVKSMRSIAHIFYDF